MEHELYKALTINCDQCFGLCCVALCFSKLDGFPEDKAAGQPCKYLEQNHMCSMHNSLKNKGLNGCVSYDCFGAGQKVLQDTHRGDNWQENKQLSEEIFHSFSAMRQLYEMLWYLLEAKTHNKTLKMSEQIDRLLKETIGATLLNSANLKQFDLNGLRERIRPVLKEISEEVRSWYRQRIKREGKNPKVNCKDYLGKDMRKLNLVGADLRGACLIAANLENMQLEGADLLGADLRDTNIKGANLETGIFITQGQLNSAIGDMETKIPQNLKRPASW